MVDYLLGDDRLPQLGGPVERTSEIIKGSAVKASRIGETAYRAVELRTVDVIRGLGARSLSRASQPSQKKPRLRAVRSPSQERTVQAVRQVIRSRRALAAGGDQVDRKFVSDGVPAVQPTVGLETGQTAWYEGRQDRRGAIADRRAAVGSPAPMSDDQRLRLEERRQPELIGA